jgi:hypothetical protein
MATTYKVLAQIAPSATTATTLYTVPSATSTIVSTITICNRSSVAVTYRIAIRTGGAALSNEDYLAYDVALAANDTTALTLGVTLATTDVVTVYASSADLSFNMFGAEVA